MLRTSLRHRNGISVVEAARRLGLSQSSVYMALQKGKIFSTRVQGKTVITEGALQDYRARQRSQYRASISFHT